MNYMFVLCVFGRRDTHVIVPCGNQRTPVGVKFFLLNGFPGIKGSSALAWHCLLLLSHLVSPGVFSFILIAKLFPLV